MTRLKRNFWRLAWVLFTNGFVVILFLNGPIRSKHEQQLLYQAMGTPASPFSYLHEFFSDPWRPIIVVTLLVGIVAEASRNVLSAVMNVGVWVVWLFLFLRDAVQVARGQADSEVSASLLMTICVALAVVVAANVSFYVDAVRRTQTSPEVREK
jgi:hypothetical protein